MQKKQNALSSAPAKNEFVRKLYLLRDDDGDIALVLVRNWNQNFEKCLRDTYRAQKENGGESSAELLGYLRAAGYDFAQMAYDTVNFDRNNESEA